MSGTPTPSATPAAPSAAAAPHPAGAGGARRRDSGPHAGYPRVSHQSRRLVRRFAERLGDYDEQAREQIVAAARWANARHAGQRRASGDPFIVHPLEAASILVESRLDPDTVIAALLHDVVEDTGSTHDEIRETFGATVSELVQGVTKISIIKGMSRSVQAAESIRKMLFAMVRDIRVILIKLADKLHNMRTLEYHAVDARKRIARECLDIYCPLAGRLGMYRIRTELEDLAFKHLYPRAYGQLREFVSETRAARDQYLRSISAALLAEAHRADLQVEVATRAKHFYSIYQKMKSRGHLAQEIRDLLGVRVICDTTGECYEIMGIVHKLWPPIEGRFKDYIAMPKSNRYQSLHTTVMAAGRPLEVQIRTQEMHDTAENGVAAHWWYKTQREGARLAASELSIINKLRDWQPAQAASTDFLEQIKRELLRDSIYVFTPQGDIIELPRGSTPIDFAYHIHTEIGTHCMAAKANGVIMPLSGELKNTQVIEIVTSPSAHPHVGWLRTVKTARARQKIRHWLTQEDPDLIFQRNIVAKPAPETRRRRRGARSAKPRRTAAGAAAAAGPPAQRAKAAPSRVSLSGADDHGVLISLARCCRPVPGDDIVGYVSRGRGITVHCASCANVHNIRDYDERHVEVHWETAVPRLTYRFTVVATADTRLFSEIERTIRSYGGTLISGELDENAAATRTGHFTVEVKNKRDYGRVVKHLKGLDAVKQLHREGASR